MSSLRNAIPRRTHKERAQPQERKKFGLLEKHKDYVLRARAFHQKEDTLRRLREKAASRNPDEFYFKMVNTRMVDGIHRPKSEANEYTPEELMLMKTQDIGYVLQKLQSEKKKIERLNSALHTLDHQPENKHVFYAEDREEAKEIQSKQFEKRDSLASVKVPGRIKKKQLHLTENWKQGKKGFKTWKSTTRIWPCKENCRNLGESVNLVKMKLFNRQLDLCINGVQNASVRLYSSSTLI
ncbi:unnamed protein product [Musa textilis]